MSEEGAGEDTGGASRGGPSSALGALKRKDAAECVTVEVVGRDPISLRIHPLQHERVDHRHQVLHGSGDRILLLLRVGQVAAPASQ
jgi:hypothetical protein